MGAPKHSHRGTVLFLVVLFLLIVIVFRGSILPLLGTTAKEIQKESVSKSKTNTLESINNDNSSSTSGLDVDVDIDNKSSNSSSNSNSNSNSNDPQDQLASSNTKNTTVLIEKESKAEVPKISESLWSDFQVTLDNSKRCDAVLDDDYMNSMTSVMLQQWRYHNVSQDSWNQLEQTWGDALQACHGPIPQHIITSSQSTAAAWLEGATQTCGNSTISLALKGTSAEYCTIGWVDLTTKAIDTNDDEHIQRMFTKTARCALHLEYPLSLREQLHPGTTKLPTLRDRGYQPKRVLVLSLTMGEGVIFKSCKLLHTGYERGWEMVFVTGKFQRVEHKYQYAIQALERTIATSNVSADDTLVVFADSFDMLVNRRPDQVIERFVDQPYPILWSTEDNCFPLKSWPFSLNMKEHVCDKLFPFPSDQQQSLSYKRQFINAGGWIGVATVAQSMLLALSKRVIQAMNWKARRAHKRNRYEDMHDCYKHGTDQLLANVLYLKEGNKVGLDMVSTFFSSNPLSSSLDDRLKLQAHNDTEGTVGAWCYNATEGPEGKPVKREFEPCPAFLHFNGGGSQGEKVMKAYHGIFKGEETIMGCNPTYGSLEVVDLDTGLSYFHVEKGNQSSGYEWPCKAPPASSCQ